MRPGSDFGNRGFGQMVERFADRLERLDHFYVPRISLFLTIDVPPDLHDMHRHEKSAKNACDAIGFQSLRPIGGLGQCDAHGLLFKQFRRVFRRLDRSFTRGDFLRRPLCRPPRRVYFPHCVLGVGVLGEVVAAGE